jgi:hypothetical protein
MWSRGYDCCCECGLSDSPHMAKGKCQRCYQRGYRARNAERIAESKRDWYAAHPGYHAKQRETQHFGGLRQQALRRDGNRCTECGSPKNLVVHHKDGEGRGKKDPNNHIDNLTTLCRACHAKHHSTNKGWSRHHECCRQCNRTDRKHNAKGLCWSCYHKWRDREQKLSP